MLGRARVVGVVGVGRHEDEVVWVLDLVVLPAGDLFGPVVLEEEVGVDPLLSSLAVGEERDVDLDGDGEDELLAAGVDSVGSHP